MKQNYKMTIAYDGTRFFGWEHQPDRDTIQGKLETALPPVSYPSLSDDNARRLSESIELLTERGVKAIVGLDELDATRKLRDRLRYVARKNP